MRRSIGVVLLLGGIAVGWNLMRSAPGASLSVPNDFLSLVDERRYEQAIDLVHPRCEVDVADLQRLFMGAEIDYQLSDELLDTSVNFRTVAEGDRRRFVAKGSLSVGGEPQPGISIGVWSDGPDWKICSVSIIDPTLIEGD